MFHRSPWQRERREEPQQSNATSRDLTTDVFPEMTTTEVVSEFFYVGGRELKALHDWYIHVHGYLATAVCIFGIVANLLNIVVLTRRNMISPTNCILTALAMSDGLTMLAYLPFALRFYVLYGIEATPERNSLEAVRFMLFYACFSVVVHTVSIWLTVTLAIFRYIFIRYPRQGAVWCSLQRAKLAIFVVNLVTLIVCIPNFVTIRVQGSQDYVDVENNVTSVIWFVEFKQDSETDIFVKNLNFWIQALLVKLVPCIGLTILSLLLVRTMKVAEERRRNLHNKATGNGKDDSARYRKTNRTTRMLLVVVMLFLITEFPQGIINLMSGVADTQFVVEVYMTLGDLLDILALINNGVNFILYCTMSKQFRDTFLYVFLPCLTSDGQVKVMTTAVTKTTAE